MTNLISTKLPIVSKEFAMAIRDRFKPISIKAGINRDALMISHGEQRVVEFIMANITLPDELKPKPKNFWDMFSNRVS